MNTSTVYIVIAILALAAIAIAFFGVKPVGRRQKLPPLAGLAFGLIGQSSKHISLVQLLLLSSNNESPLVD